MDWDYFNKDLSVIPETLLGVAIVYVSIVIYIRVFGLKSFAKMTGYDFASTIAIGSLMGTIVVNGAPSILVGLAILAAMFLMNWLLTLLRFNSNTAEEVMSNDPILLMDGQKILHENLRKTKVTESTLRGKLREANVTQLSQVLAVVLESTGDVSVLHDDGDLELDAYLLEGVQR